jgi:hypothetical protein
MGLKRNAMPAGGSSASRPRAAMVRAGDNAMPIEPLVAARIGGFSWQVR